MLVSRDGFWCLLIPACISDVICLVGVVAFFCVFPASLSVGGDTSWMAASEGSSAFRTESYSASPDNVSAAAGNSDELLNATGLLDNPVGRHSDYEQAKHLIDSVIQRNPRDVEAYKQLARYHIKAGVVNETSFDSGNLAAAEAALNQALAIDPNYAGAYVLFGNLYRLMGNLAAAKDALTKAEQLGSNDPWLYLNLADIYLDENKYGEAVSLAEKALREGGNSLAMMKGYRVLTEAYTFSGQLDQANEVFRRQLSQDPSAWNHGNYASFLLYRLGDYESAILHAREALRIMDYRNGRRILAAALFRKWAQYAVVERNPDMGRNYYDEARQIYPDTATIIQDASTSSHTSMTVEALRQHDGR